MRNFLYHVKHAHARIFGYPKESIAAADSLDYDAYWRDKRGAHLGSLSAWQKNRADFILSIVGRETAPLEVADIGCGDGAILSYLRERAGSALITTCVGYDSSAVALERARESGIETHSLDVSEKNAYSQIRPADYCLLLETLEHVPDSEALLLSALSKSRKGVFFSFPNTGYLMHRLRLLLGRFPLQWRVFPNEHVRFWTYADLVWWLKALGIRSYQVHAYQGVPGLNRIFPGLFAAGLIVFIPREGDVS